MPRSPFYFALAGCFILLSATASWADTPYEQHKDLVYGQAHGVGLLMDVFVPKANPNGLAIVDIASGAWFSDRGKIRDHRMARMYDILCARGYVVFALRPGSVSKYTGNEMVGNIERGIRYVKHHAKEYGIDPDNLGIAGASAGGHLASLIAVLPKDANPNAKDAIERHDTRVSAAGIFFPPTNFLDWDGQKRSFASIGRLFFAGGLDGRSQKEIDNRAKALSPYFQVDGPTPPFLIFHGDADPLVPLQQSEIFVEKLKAAGSEATLIVKEGGGHPWMTIYEEVAILADWFDKTLGGKS